MFSRKLLRIVDFNRIDEKARKVDKKRKRGRKERKREGTKKPLRATIFIKKLCILSRPSGRSAAPLALLINLYLWIKFLEFLTILMRVV